VLERDLHNGRAHLVLAHVLAQRGAQQQALMELRLAVESDPTLAGRAAGVAVDITQDFETLKRAVPDGALGSGTLLAIASSLSRPEQAPLRLRCLKEAIHRNPNELLARQALADLLLADLSKPRGRALCAAEQLAHCKKLVLEQARRLARSPKIGWRGHYLQARLELYGGDPGVAARLLEEHCPRKTEGAGCLRDWVLATLRSGTIKDTRLAGAALSAAACGSSKSCSGSLDWLAATLESAKRLEAAYGYAERAARLEPTAERWMRAARLAASLGLVAQANAGFRHALALRPGDAQLRQRVEAEQSSLRKRATPRP